MEDSELKAKKGEGPLVRMWSDGSAVVGSVVPLRNSPVKFAGFNGHCMVCRPPLGIGAFAVIRSSDPLGWTLPRKPGSNKE